MDISTVSVSYEKGRVEVPDKFPAVWCKKQLFFHLFPNHRCYQGALLRRMLEPHFDYLELTADKYKGFRLFTLEQSQRITKILSGATGK